jgi:hypothetical protein
MTAVSNGPGRSTPFPGAYAARRGTEISDAADGRDATRVRRCISITSIVGNANGALQFVDSRGRNADERTGRRAPILQGALARTQAASGFAPDPSTIATALGDRLEREWAIGVICDNEQAFHRRN